MSHTYKNEQFENSNATLEAGQDDQEFEQWMQQALETPNEAEISVPAGLAARMHAWTAVEMAAQRQAARTATAAISSLAFRDFGLLNTGAGNRRALFASTAMNLAVAALVVVVTGFVHNTFVAPTNTTVLVAPNLKPVRETPPPTPPPPRMLNVPRPVVEPMVTPAKVELPPDLKPVIATTPRLNMPAPAPIRVEPAPGPRAISLSASAAPVGASVPKPAGIALGHPSGPLTTSLNGPAVSPVTLSAAVGTPAGRGSGVASKDVHIGSGMASGSKTAGTGAGPVQLSGLQTGVPDAHDTGHRGAALIQIAPAQQHARSVEHGEVIVAMAKPPVITYLPKPAYTDEAKALHIQGDIRLNVRMRADGSVDVMSVANGLGHGLDEVALQTARNMRFHPALDARGNPTDFTTVVTIHFLQN